MKKTAGDDGSAAAALEAAGGQGPGGQPHTEIEESWRFFGLCEKGKGRRSGNQILIGVRVRHHPTAGRPPHTILHPLLDVCVGGRGRGGHV